MGDALHHMTVIRYHPDGRPWSEEDTVGPCWHQVEQAIRRMDNNEYPVLQMNPGVFEDDENILNVVGGAGRWALFQLGGDWEFEAPVGEARQERLWESDQGYICSAKKVTTDLDFVIGLCRVFFESGSYDDVRTFVAGKTPATVGPATSEVEHD